MQPQEQSKFVMNSYYRRSLLTGLVLIVFSLFVNFYAGLYAARNASNFVTDVVLSNLPVVDLDGVFVYGSILLIGFGIFTSVKKPETIPFVLKSVSLFIIVRSLFIDMTHVGPFPTALPINVLNFLSYYVFGSGLFFSGHTGLPYLMALIFWENKSLRYIFLASSIGFAIIVLLAHLHYTIDVMSAFFISYGIFKLSEKFFPKDLEIFKSRGLSK